MKKDVKSVRENIKWKSEINRGDNNDNKKQ